MSYIVLARKWRPRTFGQLVGQTALVNALTGALDQQRLHHAYLFTGTRGVGKTSVARLFAKALNCEQGISSTPCLICDTCLATEQGRLIDLIEIDGASRTRVEDTRELLDNVMYRPSHARFKIYIIDEVHMLSTHSFNALLKTLEEPPAHVKFLLATTDPQKLPLTVLSRCLQFQLKHIMMDDIVHHLQHILNDEQCTYDNDALCLIAKAAQGSMRDALSLLDQVLASGPQNVRAHDVNALLGFTQRDYAHDILGALAQRNPDELITISQRIAQDGGYFHYVLDTLLTHLHQISLLQQLSPSHHVLQNATHLRLLSTQIVPEDVQLFYQIALKGMDDLDRAPTQLIGFEMTLLRLFTFVPNTTIHIQEESPARSASNHTDASESRNVTENTTVNTKPLDVPTAAPSAPSPQSQTIIAPELPVMLSSAPQDDTWYTLFIQRHLQGLARNAAENAEYVGRDDHRVTLKIDKRHQTLFTPAVCKRIEEALSQHHDSSIRLHLIHSTEITSSPAKQKTILQAKNHQAAHTDLQEDLVFQQLRQAFASEDTLETISARSE